MFPTEIPVPCEENKNGDIQQLIAQTQNDQGTLDGTPTQNDQGMGHLIMTVTTMTKRKFHQITT